LSGAAEGTQEIAAAMTTRLSLEKLTDDKALNNFIWDLRA
jgi:hypothetical protein